MKDRNVQHASRFRLTKVPGTDDVYDLIPAPGEVYEEGTLINKSALLKDATAALFGLDENAVPDDAMAILSRFHKGLGNEYVWEKKTIYVDTGTPITRSVSLLYNGSGASAKYSDTAKIENGVVVMDNPKTVTFSQLKSLGNSLKGKFFMAISDTGQAVFGSGTLVYIPETASISSTTNNVNTSAFSYPIAAENLIGYVNSAGPNAYPPAVSDGYTYTYFGKIGEKVRIETGSYTGTGTYGSSNPNSLTFGFEPKIVFISYSGSDYGPASRFAIIYCYALTSNYPNDSYGYGYSLIYSTGSLSNQNNMAKLVGNVLYFYNKETATAQLNLNGETYKYIAIG